MRQFTHGGNWYVLGQSEFGYGIWQIGAESGDPVAGYPATAAGWSAAVQEFQRLEPYGRPLEAQAATSVLPAIAPAYSPVTGYPSVGRPIPQQNNGMATAGGALGITGAVLSLIPLVGIAIGLVLGILAIIFSEVFSRHWITE